MKQTATALYTFASGFTWKAYPEFGVPDTAVLPYITYSVQESVWDEMGMLQMRLWYKGTGYNTLNTKIDEIAAEVEPGKYIPTASGGLYIFKGSPWCQYQPSDEADLKIAYLNFNVNYETY